ncbi:MAG: hypothetical protein WCF90_08820 [Methanomicrobiales archaeon]
MVTRVTTEPNQIPTSQIAITIEPTLGGGKGRIDTYCNIDGATVYYDGVPQGNIAGDILSVGLSPICRRAVNTWKKIRP